ncbi:MAG: hypothetical protein JW789_03140 [Candidatus Aenigmarchaeota archaeon]|nr:hypothetical protein [Candidatus Aenigmarchaeota archaeon]
MSENFRKMGMAINTGDEVNLAELHSRGYVLSEGSANPLGDVYANPETRHALVLGESNANGNYRVAFSFPSSEPV